MAATLTPSSELTYLSFPIEKTETTADGDVLVYGKATDGSVDSDEQIVDPDWSAKAIADWLSSGANVRVQHNAQRDPAGVGIEVDSTAGNETWVKSLVVEPVAKTLVLKKALRAYSVGIARPKIVRDSVARGGRIVGGEIVEISLVDRPANKNCGIELVKADKDGNVEWVGKMFGDSELLTKSAAVEETVSLPAHSSFSPADLAKLLEHRRVAEDTVEKRQMDPNVGGGTDRDKIPASNFAGRDRSFPIVKPGDVSDAASSIGRAGSSNFGSDKLKENIIRIARRLGPEFVQELPDSWKSEEVHTTETVEKKKSKKAKAQAEEDGGSSPFAGAHPSFSGDHQPPHDAGDPAIKGAKDCAKCGKSFHSDSKLRKCDKCGADLPMADKGAEEPKAVKKTKAQCAGCGANVDANHNFCPECGNDMSAVKMAKCDCGCGDDCSCPSGCTCGCSGCMKGAKAQKGHDFNCLGCGRELDDDEKYCPGCGKQHPGYEGTNTKAGKPTPGAGVTGEAASDIEPVPAHREPDGAAVEALEHDASLPTDPDAAMKTVTRIKSIGAPSNLAELHDALCAGFHPNDVAAAHPSFKFDDLDVSYWQSQALDAATGGTLEQATKATGLWQNAETVKGAGTGVINDLRLEAYKSFRDANPGPTSFPKPTELSPSKFNRPYLSAGHADVSPGASGPNTASVPSQSMDANDYTRGYLTGGHASDSPSNKSTGVVSRVEYSSHLRTAAANAMRSMHDHISQTFPDLCPMVAPGLGGQPPTGARPVPVGVGKSKKAKKAKAAKTVKSATVASEVVPAPAAASDPIVAELVKQVSMLTEQITTLSGNVDALGDLPDPRVAAFKGVGQNPITKSAGLPGVATVAETAERTQLMMMRELEGQFRTSPDPAQREAAWNALIKMRGLPTT